MQKILFTIVGVILAIVAVFLMISFVVSKLN